MSIGEKILDEIGDALKLIKTDNNYSFDLPDEYINRGYISKEKVNTYPTAYYELGDDENEMEGSADDIEDVKLNAAIGIYFECDSGQGNLSTMGEQIRADIKAFLHQYNHVKPNCLYFKTVPEVHGWEYLRSSVLLDEGQNKGLMAVIFQIRYRLFPNQQN